MQDAEQLTNKANEHFEAGRYRQAEKLYRKMLDEEPDNYQTLLMMGVCRQHRKDGSSALEYFRKAVAAEDNRPVTHYHLGRQYLEMRNIDQARESLAQAIALNPNHAPARALMGYSFIMAGEYDHAIEELKVARRADENYAQVSTMLALALLETGQLDEAAKEANRAARLAPSDAGAQSILGRVLLAQGHVHFAEQCFRTALQKHPNNLELKAGLGKALRMAGRTAEAAQVLESALRGGLQQPDVVVEYAHALAGLGRAGEAHSLLEHLPESARDDRFRVLQSDLKLVIGDHAGARESIDSLPKSNPERALLRARLFMSEGDHDNAVRVLEPLRDDSAEDIARRARLGTADAFFVAGRSEQAYDVLEPLLTADPPDRMALNLWLGFLRREKRWDALISWVEQMLTRSGLGDADKAQAAALLATALDASGKYDRAAQYLEGAAWREPEFLGAYMSDASRQARDDLMAAGEEQWKQLGSGQTPPEAAPVFVLGWLGSGQAELAATLSDHPDVRTLAADSWQERMRIAGGLARLGGPAVSNAQCQAARERFLALAGAAAGAGAVLLDPLTFEVALMPGLARLFPGATVIVLSAQEADLHLHWVMNGYRRPLDILDAYRRERELFQHIQDKLPLNFIVLTRHRLLGETGKVLEPLYGQLGLDWNAAISERFRERAEAGNLRPDGHWKHYAALLGRD